MTFCVQVAYIHVLKAFPTLDQNCGKYTMKFLKANLKGVIITDSPMYNIYRGKTLHR